MSKKTMKRGLALGALMAFVITGSAMAAEDVGNNGFTINTVIDIQNGGTFEITENPSSNIKGVEITTLSIENPTLDITNAVKYSVTATGEYGQSVQTFQAKANAADKDGNVLNSYTLNFKDAAEFYVKTDYTGANTSQATALNLQGGATVNLNGNVTATAESMNAGSGKSAYAILINGYQEPAEMNFNGQTVTLKAITYTDRGIEYENTTTEKPVSYRHRGEVAGLAVADGKATASANTKVKIEVESNGTTVGSDGKHYSYDKDGEELKTGIYGASYAYGILTEGGGTVDLKGDTEISVTSKAARAVGIKVIDGYDTSSNPTQIAPAAVTLNNVLVTVESKGDAYGTHLAKLKGSNENNVKLTTTGDVVINATSTENIAIGILAEDGSVAELENLEITANANNGTAHGLKIVDSGTTANINGDLTVCATGSTVATGVNVQSGAKVTLGNDKTSIIDIVAKSTSENAPWKTVVGIQTYKDGAEVKVVADTVNVVATSTGNAWAYGVSANGDSTVAGTESAISIDANDINIHTSSSDNERNSAITTMSGSKMTIEGNLTASGTNVITTRGNGEININQSSKNTVKLDGDIRFDEKATGVINSEVNINLVDAESYLNGNIYTMTYDDVDANGKVSGEKKSANEDGRVNGMTLSVSNGAQWTATDDSFVNDLTVANGGKVAMTGEDAMTITVNNLNGEGGLVETNSFENQMTVEKTGEDFGNLTVQAIGNAADNIAAAADQTTELQKLADVVATETENGDRTSVATTVATEDGDIAGAYSAQVGEDGKVIAKTITKAIAQKNENISDATMNLKAHWRAHMNDMNKRMGDLRLSNGETGVWTRMVRGESEYDGSKVQYNQYQLGYDEKLSVDKRWTVGAAVTFAKGDGSYGSGTTDDKSTAFAIYGSKLNNDGTFVDLIARYARVESDLEDVHSGNGDYSTNGYSVSAEFGKRIEQTNGLWVEPQVELTYGTIDSADFIMSNGKEVHVDSMDSLVARLGLSIGKDIKQGNVYARASYLYDFDGESETSFSRGAVQGDVVKEDFGGGWWEVGVGANINLSKATYIYADVEKTFGCEVDTNWQWNLGVRYSF